MQPIIITCQFESEVEEYFNRFRLQYFPSAKNYLNAHLTLFHRLLLPVESVIETITQKTFSLKPFETLVERIAFTGRGVAFVLSSKELSNMHKNLQNAFKDSLTTQDRQKLWPHVTIQNKAPVQESKAVAALLQQEFKPFLANVTGLQLYYYLDGPWKFIDNICFK